MSLLNWSPAYAFTAQAASNIPTGSGVFYLLADETERSALFIGGAKNLREEFYYELEQQRTIMRPRASFFRYAQTLQPSENAAKLLEAHKRKYAQRPAFNSAF